MQKDLLPENSRHERRRKALSSGFRILLPERILFPPFRSLFPGVQGCPPCGNGRVNIPNE